MNEIVLIGSGGHSNSCIDVILTENKFKIAGFVVKNKNEENENLKFPILGSDDDLPFIRKRFQYAIITVGQIKSSLPRENLYKKLSGLKFKIPTIVSPYSYVSKMSNIGPGTIIMHNSVINSNVKIGYNCIINSKSLIEHDVIIGNNTHISTGAIINGNTKIGNKCFVGSGAILKNNINVTDEVIISQGAIIKSNISHPKTIN